MTRPASDGVIDIGYDTARNRGIGGRAIVEIVAAAHTLGVKAITADAAIDKFAPQRLLERAASSEPTSASTPEMVS